METKEVYIILEANGHLTPLLLVGRTREAVVVFDRCHINLPEIAVGREIEETIYLCNLSDLPINFKFDKTTFKCNDSVDKLAILPIGGCVHPDDR